MALRLLGLFGECMGRLDMRLLDHGECEGACVSYHPYYQKNAIYLHSTETLTIPNSSVRLGGGYFTSLPCEPFQMMVHPRCYQQGDSPSLTFLVMKIFINDPKFYHYDIVTFDTL